MGDHTSNLPLNHFPFFAHADPQTPPPLPSDPIDPIDREQAEQISEQMQPTDEQRKELMEIEKLPSTRKNTKPKPLRVSSP